MALLLPCMFKAQSSRMSKALRNLCHSLCEYHIIPSLAFVAPQDHHFVNLMICMG